MVSASGDKPLAGCRVLIVEDDGLLAYRIVQFLEEIGVTAVGPFATMIAALSGITEIDAIDGAILDIGLGGETSYPLAEALQTTGIPFLFLTGTDRINLPPRFSRTAHLRKPHSDVELMGELIKLDMR
jgi:CheY-like chemotaxis protein